jgi:hypothetical protein
VVVYTEQVDAPDVRACESVGGPAWIEVHPERAVVRPGALREEEDADEELGRERAELEGRKSGTELRQLVLV